jgi:hypothetical protein
MKYKFKNPAQLVTTIATYVIGVLTIVGAISIVTHYIQSTEIENQIISWKSIVVAHGDTIWDIADDERYNSYDPRIISDIIEEKNDITGNITAGQEILVPVMK